MCRLLYLPRKVRPALPMLVQWMKDLEKSCGGDGCGYATIKGGVVKGTGLTPAICSRPISRCRARVLWHTRKVSCGGKCDDLCHPFATRFGWLAHNGHWGKGAFAAQLLSGEWSDSRIAAQWITLYDWHSFCRHADSGVWLHLTPQGLQVHYASGTLYKETRTKALCSEPTSLWGDWQPVEYGSYDAGQPIKTRKDKAAVKYVWESATSYREPAYERPTKITHKEDNPIEKAVFFPWRKEGNSTNYVR